MVYGSLDKYLVGRLVVVVVAVRCGRYKHKQSKVRVPVLVVPFLVEARAIFVTSP